MISDTTDRVNTIAHILDYLAPMFKDKHGDREIRAKIEEGLYDLECIEERYWELADIFKSTRELLIVEVNTGLELRKEIDNLERKLGIIKINRDTKLSRVINKRIKNVSADLKE